MQTDIEKLRRKLRFIGLDITEKKNDWAIEVSDGELLGYIDISDNNKLVAPEYTGIKMLKHFVVCNVNSGRSLMVRGRVSNILDTVLITIISGGISIDEWKLQLVIVLDNNNETHTYIVNHKGEKLELKHHNAKFNLKSRRISPKTGKEVCVIAAILNQLEPMSDDILFSIEIDEDLNILGYNKI